MYRLAMVALVGATLTALTPISSGAIGKAPRRNGRIAFSRFDPTTKDDAVYTVNPNGKRVQLVWARAEGGTWAPDGRRLAFFVHPDGPERIVNVDTRKYVDLPTHYPGGLFLPCAVWAPDGKRLACEGFGPDNDPSQNGIYTVRASDGGDVERVTTAPGGDDFPGDNSPDGKRLVFFRAGDEPALYVVGTEPAVGSCGSRRPASSRASSAGAGRRAGTGSCSRARRRLRPRTRFTSWAQTATG